MRGSNERGNASHSIGEVEIGDDAERELRHREKKVCPAAREHRGEFATAGFTKRKEWRDKFP